MSKFNRWIILFGATLLLAGSWASAASTPQEIFQTIKDTGDETVDTQKLMMFGAAVAGLVVFLIFISQRRKRHDNPRAVNHHGRLMKEVSKAIGLKSGEVKRLKQLAEGKSLASPLTLLLCPSLLKVPAKKAA